MAFDVFNAQRRIPVVLENLRQPGFKGKQRKVRKQTEENFTMQKTYINIYLFLNILVIRKIRMTCYARYFKKHIFPLSGSHFTLQGPLHQQSDTLARPNSKRRPAGLVYPQKGKKNSSINTPLPIESNNLRKILENHYPIQTTVVLGTLGN